MQSVNRLNAVLLIVMTMLLSACGAKEVRTTTEGDSPVAVEHLTGTEPTRLTLTSNAAGRLDIQTAVVQDTEIKGIQYKVIPYAAILYDVQGDTWVYTNPEPLTFVRTPVTVDYIEGNQAVLLEGPSSGSNVVIVGAEELYGSETEFEEE